MTHTYEYVLTYTTINQWRIRENICSHIRQTCACLTCRTWSRAAMKSLSDRNPAGTGMYGKYPTRPTASADDELTFITCTWTGVQLLCPNPAKPPSQLMLNSATLPVPLRETCAASNKFPYCMPPPYKRAPVWGWYSFCGSQWIRIPCLIKALHRLIHTYTGSMWTNWTRVHPGKLNEDKSMTCVFVTLSQKLPACLSTRLCRTRQELGHLCPDSLPLPTRRLTAWRTRSLTVLGVVFIFKNNRQKLWLQAACASDTCESHKVCNYVCVCCIRYKWFTYT